MSFTIPGFLTDRVSSGESGDQWAKKSTNVDSRSMRQLCNEGKAEPGRRALVRFEDGAPFTFTGTLIRVEVIVDADQALDAVKVGRSEMARQ